MNNYPRERYGIPAKADIVIGISIGQELEMESLQMIDDNHGEMIVKGPEENFDPLIKGWKSVYKDVTYEDIEESKQEYLTRSELFVPKKAINKNIGTTITNINRKIHITFK